MNDNMTIDEKELVHQRDLEYIRNFKLIHDDFMKKVFTDEDCTELLLRIIIENLGALFATCRDMQKSTKIRHFRTIHKNSFTLFFAEFLHP